MFMTIRTGMPLTELMTGTTARKKEAFTRLDGGPMFAFPDNLDPGQAIVTNITLLPGGEGVMVELTCSRGDAQHTKLFTKITGPRVAIQAVRVGQW